MARAPLQLSEPLYSWDTSVAEEHVVCFDELHQRVIHQQKGSFFAIDIVEKGSAPDGLSVRFDADGLRCVRFSPDGLYFAFVCGKNVIGVVETLQPTSEPIVLPLKACGPKSDCEILACFWLPSLGRQPDSADLAVVSAAGVELLRLYFESRTAKLVKAFPVAVRMCWAEPTSGMVLICTTSRTLQPFDLRAKVPQKLSKFELVSGKSKTIEKHDVGVMTIYEATYCIHADNHNGRISLRNISNPSQATPEHDIVIDVAAEGTSLGMLRLSKVDNLLIVHCVEQKASVMFDIRHRDKSVVPAICGPQVVDVDDGGPHDCDWQSWEYVSGSTIIDNKNGMVLRLKVNMVSVLREFSAHDPHDLATVIRLVLRRTNCREHTVQLFKRALEAKTSFKEMSQGFGVMNHAYRLAIESLSSRTSPGQSGQNTVSLHQLESVIGQQSILSEKDMVAQVFYPHFLDTSDQQSPPVADAKTAATAANGASTEDLGETNSASLLDAWRIPLRPRPKDVGTCNGSRPERSPYLVSMVVAYLRSLLSMQILPHRMFQCFVFDLCMFYDQEHTLQQLLHYHVLLDSAELLQRLKELALLRSCTWATQACLDMALRLQDHVTVADMLLHTRQYLDVVPFLLSQQVASFELRKLLQQAAEDRKAREDDPSLLDYLINEIGMWTGEADRDPRCVHPNLTDCERWISTGSASPIGAGGGTAGSRPTAVA